MNLILNIFCKLKNKKHFHRTAHENEVSGYHNKNGIYGRLINRALNKSDLIFTQNKSHQEYIKKELSKRVILF